MLKVFLVEDEFVVREGIKKIDWAAHGYEFCGEAGDGELALPMIAKLKPDIVITDIKMPFMDGLELSRHIRKDYPNIEIVILSGYEEFGYAKEAISLGISRYLTKPISATELIKEIDELRTAIEERKIEQEIADRYLHDIEEDTERERKEFFGELVSGTKTVSELIERGEQLDINLQASAYCIMLSTISLKNHAYNEFSNVIVEIGNEFEAWLHNKDYEVFDRDIEGHAIIVSADSDTELSKRIEEYVNKFIEIVKKYDGIRYYIGIGKIVFRISELPKSFETASTSFAHRYFDADSNVVYYSSEGIDFVQRDESDIQISEIDSRLFDRSRLAEFLKTGENDEVEFFLKELFDSIGDNALKSNLYRQYIAMDIYFTVVDFAVAMGFERSEIEAVDTSLKVAESVDSVKEYGERIVCQVIELRNSVSRNKYKDIVEEIIKYIEENYSDEDLSLNTLAEHVGFSPNHFSMIFSQQTGVTLSKYLIDYRIGKAKEALKCTSKKSSEIALDIGYKDPHYFSYMFKKITGMTPTQYREGK